MAEKEKKDFKHRALMVAAGLHLFLLILFFFIMAWRAPDPPKPNYGIELNFGLEQAGSGDVQPLEQPSPQPQEQPQPEESTPQPVEDNQEVQEVTETTPQESVTQPDEGLVSEKPVEPQPKEVQKPVEKPKQKSKPEVDQRSLFPGGNQSQGDQENASGDQGSREGSVDAQALYGSQGGGGGGASLNMAGWSWDQVPKPQDTSSETGRIVFQIKIDDQGYVVSVKTIESTVSPAIERIYLDEVRKTTFSKTDNASVPPFSTGTITFVLKAR